MIEFVVGVFVGFVPAAGLCVALDRRAESRDYVRRRVDSTPAALPGAYEPWSERSLPGSRTHVFVDGEVR